MLILAITLALLAFYTLLGSAVLALFEPRGPAAAPTPVRFALLAPATGMALTALVVSMASFYGLPVRLIAPWAAVILGFGAIGIHVWRRPPRPWRPILQTGAVMVAAWAFAFWPVFLYGEHWVAFFNSDMAHFCAVADRLIDGPFWAQPTVQDLAGFDLALRKTFHHTFGNDRFASEELLAFTSVLAGRPPISVYMAVLGAAYGVQLAALMALVAGPQGRLRLAWLAAGILAILPLNLFGLYSQLLPQCGGIALLLASFTLLAQPEARATARLVTLQVLVFGAFAILYPEVSPFAVLGFGLLLGLRWWRERAFPASDLAAPLRSVPLTALVLNKALVLMLLFMVYHRLPGGLTTEKELIFPHFLLPSGVSIFVGWQKITNFLPPVQQDLAIAVSLALLAVFLGAVFLRAYRTVEPVFVLAATMLGFCVYFVVQGNDFGSLKSAMFVQPVVAGTLAVLLAEKRGWLVRSAIGAVLALNGHRAIGYARIAASNESAFYGDTRQLSRFGPVLPPVQAGEKFYVDLPSVVFEDTVYPQLKGAYAYNANRTFFDNALIPDPGPRLAQSLFRLIWPEAAYEQTANQRAAELARTTPQHHGALGTEFTLTRNPEVRHFEGFTVLTPRREAWQFNQLHEPLPTNGSLFSLVPYRELHDYLVFVHSSRGSLFYTGHRFDAAFYQPQPDVYFPGQRFFRVGQYLLFEVLNPTPSVRLRVALTRTINPASAKSLEGLVTIRAAELQTLPSHGAGAMNLYSAPLRPLEIDGQHFLAVELNAPLFRFPDHKSPLMRLYRRDLLIDSAASVGFMRDLSLVAEDEYQKLPRPTGIRDIPTDLADPALEFSGLYEDGWLSPQAQFVLGRPAVATEYELTVEVPGQLATAAQPLGVEIQLGATSVRRELAPGLNTVRLPLPAETGTAIACILNFDRHLIFADPDSRPAAARLVKVELH